MAEDTISNEVPSEFELKIERFLRWAGALMAGLSILMSGRNGGVSWLLSGDSPLVPLMLVWGIAIAVIFRPEPEAESSGMVAFNTGTEPSEVRDLRAVISLAPEAAWERIAALLLKGSEFSQNAVLNNGAMLARPLYTAVFEAMQNLELLDANSKKLTGRGRVAFAGLYRESAASDPPAPTVQSQSGLRSYTGHGA